MLVPAGGWQEASQEPARGEQGQADHPQFAEGGPWPLRVRPPERRGNFGHQHTAAG